MSFVEQLNAAIDANNSLLCIGLDVDLEKMPASIRNSKTPLLNFNKAIIDVTIDQVCAFKPNSAFYEAHGPSGIEQLQQTVIYIHEKYPNVPVILDAKRADIGNTNNGYIRFAFDYLKADAITLHPYLGGEALQPFLDQTDKGIIILCRTSNPGAAEFQDLQSTGKPLYQQVAQTVVQAWNNNSNCLLVVGANYPEEMKLIRKIVGPKMIFLVPGVGAQGGDVAAVMQNGLGANKRGLIISASRSVIYASDNDDFAEAARAEAVRANKEINKYR